jgi:hypothetical protein
VHIVMMVKSEWIHEVKFCESWVFGFRSRTKRDDLGGGMADEVLVLVSLFSDPADKEVGRGA